VSEVLLFALAAGVLTAVLAWVALLDALRWGGSLVVYRLRFPSGLTPEQLSVFLAGIQPARRGLFSVVPHLALEIIASSRGIEHRLVVPRGKAEGLLAQLQATLPGVRFELVGKTDAAGDGKARLLRRAVLPGREAPLGDERAEAAAVALLASLQPLGRDERIVLRLLVGSGFVPKLADDAQWRVSPEGMQVRGDRLRARRRKHAQPLVSVEFRVSVEAGSLGRRRQILGRLSAALSVMDSPGASVRLRAPLVLGTERFDNWIPPILGWGLTLNIREAVGLLGVPLGSPELPGVATGVSRQLLPGPDTFRRGVVVAESDHPSQSGRLLRLGTKERLQHLHVVGPTGTGKSTLLAHLILQDIEARRAVVVIDPKRDLVEAVLDRIPSERSGDVVLLDPTDTDRPVGLNVLAGGGGEASRELAAEFTLGILRSLFADSWGPRTDDVLRSGLLTLARTRSGSGRSWTLLELPDLLTDDQFRTSVLRQGGVPEAVRGFWGWYGGLSEANRATVIGPSLNKLRAFTTRTPVRLLIGQSQGLDLTRLLIERKVLLVPLSTGELGRGVAELLGSLILARLWASVRSRTRVPADRRPAAFVYLDEFQNVLRLPLDLEDMLSMSRGLGVGLTLAHQHLGQLSDSMRSAVLGTARSRVVFQLGREDARALAPEFGPLTAEDLQHLDAYHLALRGVDGGAVQRPVTGRSSSLVDSLGSAQDIRSASRERYGRGRTEVEAEIRSRTAPAESAPLGRRRKGDDS